MSFLAIGLPTSLGEIINIKYHLDLVKHKYKQIRISFRKDLWQSCLHTEAADWPQKKILWDKYLADIGNLFFTETPYVLDTARHTLYSTEDLFHRVGLPPQKANLSQLLCKGEPLNLSEEYIVITTKVRHVERSMFLPKSIQLWSTLRKLSNKYKIVILGEREVEMRREYDIYKTSIFGLYEQLISNLPADRVLDLSVPALGETVSDMTKIQQDCLIMNQAKFVITIGVGGNFCMSTSVANMAIGFRDDTLNLTNRIFQGREYPDAIITKDWNYFIQVLERYL